MEIIETKINDLLQYINNAMDMTRMVKYHHILTKHVLRSLITGRQQYLTVDKLKLLLLSSRTRMREQDAL